MLAILPDALAEAGRLLRPADPREVTLAIDRLWQFGETFGLGKPASRQVVAAATRYYSDALADLPSDLLDVAIQRTCRDYRWGGRMPLPADVRSMVASELAERRLVRARLEVAMLRARQQTPSPGPGERRPLTAEEQERLDALKAKRSSARLPGMPTEAEDLRPRTRSPAARVAAETASYVLREAADVTVAERLEDDA